MRNTRNNRPELISSKQVKKIRPFSKNMRHKERVGIELKDCKTSTGKSQMMRRRWMPLPEISFKACFGPMVWSTHIMFCPALTHSSCLRLIKGY